MGGGAAKAAPFQSGEKQPQVPFGSAQGRLSTSLRFAQDDSQMFCASLRMTGCLRVRCVAGI